MILCILAHFLTHYLCRIVRRFGCCTLVRFRRRKEKPSIFFTCDAFPCGLFRLRRVQSAACFSRDRGSTFVTRASRSHGKCVATNEGVRCAHTKGGQLGPHGALCGANTGVPHHTTSTCQRGCPPHNDTDPHTHTNATTLHMCPLHT